jgi:dTDP-4-amino-4,6-dideoxygalactose transaminase
MGGAEFEFVREAFATNWIAPVGPHVDAFEREFAATVGSPSAVALSSGTAAIHLALRLLGVGPGDEVFCSDLTFAASANPIVYQGARPVFIDSDRATWNMDPAQLEAALRDRAARGRLPKAAILVHLYGQPGDIDAIAALCARYEVPLIEDAAEALGAVYYRKAKSPELNAERLAPGAGRSATGDERRGMAPGTRGIFGIYSFNGNKIITTSGGGMLVSKDPALTAKARFLATQARDPAPHYQHSEIGFNYRMSNVVAGIGRGQLRVLDDRVEARRRNFEAYESALSGLPGLAFMPEAPGTHATRWLTCVLIDPDRFGADRETLREALAAENIEARPVWKPMHLQPVFAGCACYGGDVGADLFERGLCLPSGSNLTDEERARVVAVVKAVHRAASPKPAGRGALVSSDHA